MYWLTTSTTPAEALRKLGINLSPAEMSACIGVQITIELGQPMTADLMMPGKLMRLRLKPEGWEEYEVA